jgi:acyl-coenzyme A synthetase/AMP-(fatty) acid ligase
VAGDNPPLNLTRWCLEARASGPRRDRPAFTFVHTDGREEHWTAAEAWTRIERTARGLLGLGLRPGERVLVRLPHSPAYAFAFFGANLAGLVPIPSSPALTAEEAAFLAQDAEAAALIAGDGMAVEGFRGRVLSGHDLDALDGTAALPETHAEDPAFLIYTSGTTSRPKGVLHAQRTVSGRAMMREGWQGFGPDDVTLHAGTLNWSYTLGVGLMDAWAAGAHAILAAGVETAQWPALIGRLGVTVFIAVPTVYRQMLKYARPEDSDLSRLRHVLVAGEALAPALYDEWRARTGVEMYEALGMTELSTYVSSGPATPVRRGSPGRPQPGRRVVILDPASADPRPLPPGEVGLLASHRSDPGLMLGYWRRPDEEAAVYRGEWFTGGDLASLDTDGYVWFHGRADDTIKSFGYRLSPNEIEAALEACPGVLEVAVVGRKVDEQKTLVTACVVPQAGVALDVATLEAHAARHLAEYKRPHEFILRAEPLPRTRNGKLVRRVVLEELADG